MGEVIAFRLKNAEAGFLNQPSGLSPINEAHNRFNQALTDIQEIYGQAEKTATILAAAQAGFFTALENEADPFSDNLRSYIVSTLIDSFGIHQAGEIVDRWKTHFKTLNKQKPSHLHLV